MLARVVQRLLRDPEERKLRFGVERMRGPGDDQTAGQPAPLRRRELPLQRLDQRAGFERRRAEIPDGAACFFQRLARPLFRFMQLAEARSGELGTSARAARN